MDSKNCFIYVHIHQQPYRIKGLKMNLLVGNDILAMEKVIIDLANKFAIISSYQVTISILAQPRSHLVQRKVFVDKSLISCPEYIALVLFVCSSLSDNQDFLFKLTSHNNLMLFSYILIDLTHQMSVQKKSHQLVFLLYHCRFGTLIKVLDDNCFQVLLDSGLAKHSHISSYHHASIIVRALESYLKTCLVNRIGVYGDPETV